MIYRLAIIFTILSLVFSLSAFAASQTVNLRLVDSLTDTKGEVTAGAASRVSDVITVGTRSPEAVRYRGDGENLVLAASRENLSNGIWSKFRCTVDGTDGIIASVDNNNHFVRQIITPTADTGTTFILSVKVKPGNKTWLYLYAYDGSYPYGYFDLSGAGTVGTSDGLVTSGISGPDADGFYSCYIVYTTTNNALTDIRIAPGDANGDNTFTGDGSTVSIYAKEVQFEEIAYPNVQMDETDAGDNIVCDDTAGAAMFGADNAGGSPEVSGYAGSAYLVKVTDSTGQSAYGYAGAVHGVSTQAVDIYDSTSLLTQNWHLIEDSFDDTDVTTYDIYNVNLDELEPRAYSGTATDTIPAEAPFDDHGLFNPASVTNLLLQSNDFDEAVWAVTANKTQDETDIFGTANTAWTLEDDNAGASLAIRQSIAKNTSDLDLYVATFFIKKDSITNRFPSFYMFYTGVLNKYYVVQLNTSTGEIAERSTTAANTNYTVVDLGNWWMLTLESSDNGANNELELIVYPAHVKTFDSAADITTTGSIVVNYFHLYKSDFSPGPIIIPTTSTPVAITDQVVSWTMGSNLKDILSTAEGAATSQGTLAVTWYPYFDYGDSSGDAGIVTVKDFYSSLLYTTNTGNFKSYDQTNNPLVDPNYTALTEYKTFVRFDHDQDLGGDGGGDFRVSEIHGGSLSHGSYTDYDGAFTLGTDLHIGYDNPYPFSIKSVQFWDEWQSDNWLENVYDSAGGGLLKMQMHMKMN